ncbi:MAG: AAA family ATPase [Chloroflexi bacterium]|nr:AAA family ATPase [Chloroflexota bacterium]
MATAIPEPPVLPELPELALGELIYKTTGCAFYRAQGHGRDCALQVLELESEAEAERMMAETCRRGAFLSRAASQVVVHPLFTSRTGKTVHVLREYVPGRTLYRLLEEGPLPEERIVEIAGILAAALDALHRLGAVHREVRSANVLVMPDGDLRLADWFLPPTAKTYLTSLAPEQAGALDRPIDGRADLYGLGAILYQCAVGLVRPTPTAPRADGPTEELKEVSPALAAMIRKLLAQRPEDRYQTAAGVLQDLQLLPVLNGLLQAGRGVALGTGDDVRQAGSEAPLVGRQLELQRLRDAWDSALREHGGSVLLRGMAGTGKTRLAHTLANEVRGSGKLVLTGQCDPSGTVPFAALRGALESWLGSLQRLAEHERGQAEKRIQIAAGDFAPLLKTFSSAFDPIFPHVARAPQGQGAHERFNDILAEFLLRLAGCSGGLLLIVDDMQWVGESTRQVLSRVARRAGEAPLLLLGVARIGGGDRGSLRRLADVLEPSLRAQLRLAPLAPNHVSRFVAGLLGAEQVSPDIAQQVNSWTAGNPLAITEYVSTLTDRGCLRLEWDTWVLDQSVLGQLDLPADVNRLMSQRLEQLGDGSRAIIQVAALLGTEVSLELLATVIDDAAAVRRAVNEALDAHILYLSGPERYAFTQQQMRQALQETLEPDELMALHERIARALDRRAALGAGDIFAVARHYALAQSAEHLRRLYETSLAAGEHAAANFADAEALGFLEQAQRAAELGQLDPEPQLDEALGSVYARVGRWAAARQHLSAALDRLPTSSRRAAVHTKLAQVCMANRQLDEAWIQVEHAFHELGTPIGRGRLAVFFYTVWFTFVGLLSLRLPLGFGWAKGVRRERLILQSQLCVIGVYVSYLQHDPLRLVQLVLRQLYIGHLLGDSAELASAYTSYANALAIMGRAAAADRWSTRSVELTERLGDGFHLARIRTFHGFQRHLAGFPREAETRERRVLQTDAVWLDATDFATAHIDLALNLLLRGYCREALAIVQAAADRAQRGSGEHLNLEAKAAAMLAVLGRASEANVRLAAIESAIAGETSVWPQRNLISHQLLVQLENGALGADVDDLIARYNALGDNPRWAAFHSKHVYVFKAYVRLAQASDNPLPGALAALREALHQLDTAAGRHPTLRSHYLTIRGALRRLEGQHAESLQDLASAEVLAQEADSPWALFEIRRQGARTLAAMGNREAALRQARVAHRLAVEHGWVNRARWMRKDFESLQAPPVAAFAPLTDQRQLTPDSDRLEQSFEALLQVSVAASSTLDPAQQAQVALDETVRVLRAQRAYLFVTSPSGELSFRAGRGADGRDLPELRGYGRTIIESVRLAAEPLLASGSPDHQQADVRQPAFDDTTSMIAAPLLMRGHLLGVVYVDGPQSSPEFTPEDVSILVAIGSHIAIALDTADAVVRQSELAQTNSELLEVLQQRVEELQDSRRQITQAEERLRREIAEVLHSRVQSKLLVAGHQLSRVEGMVDADPASAKRLLSETRAEIDEIREREIRDASHLLHPSIIRVGLVPAVRSLVGRFEDFYRVSIEVDAELPKLDNILDNQLPEELRLTAYRCVEEALNNIQRHARASLAEIRLTVTPDQAISVEVRDNGRGFDSDQVKQGLGLNSIAGRVSQFGGKWRLSSAPGEGTALSITLPLPQEVKDGATLLAGSGVSPEN